MNSTNGTNGHVQFGNGDGNGNGHTTPPARTAIITGSSRGIGKAIALRLSRSGYSVCINDLPSQTTHIDLTVAEINAQHDLPPAIGIAADVSKRAEIDALIEESVERLGPLDVLVANAGVENVASVLELREEEMRRLFDVNVFGVFNCYQAGAKQFIKQGTPGKLIGAASIVAFKPSPMLCNYAASKWAVRGMTQVFAMELAKHNITVNGYAPGIVDTPMWQYIVDQTSAKTGMSKEAVVKKRTQGIAMGRPGTVEDVAGVVAFLAGPDSGYVTGQTMIVDGGTEFS